MCVYSNMEWSKNSVLVSNYCLSLVCNFLLPQEFTTVLITGVYFPPRASAKEALCELQNSHPDGLFILVKSVLLKLHVDFATRGKCAGSCIHKHSQSVLSEAPPPPQIFRSHVCYANSGIQATRRPLQTSSETGENLVCRSHL